MRIHCVPFPCKNHQKPVQHFDYFSWHKLSPLLVLSAGMEEHILKGSWHVAGSWNSKACHVGELSRKIKKARKCIKAKGALNQLRHQTSKSSNNFNWGRVVGCHHPIWELPLWWPLRPCQPSASLQRVLGRYWAPWDPKAANRTRKMQNTWVPRSRGDFVIGLAALWPTLEWVHLAGPARIRERSKMRSPAVGL